MIMNVTTEQMNDVTALINSMDKNQVNDLVESIKLRRTRLARLATNSFTVGDHVTFTGRGGNTVRGTVEKIAIKNVTVATNQGRWKVPASMLSMQVMPITA
jgi:small-conductance mechanosensitive channel|tara:strand:+ start:455 stop:757 length:303 start_codon:yes stop_codon:yes gene_type:complete